MATRTINGKYSRAKAERFLRIIESGRYNYEASDQLNIKPASIYRWKRDHDWFAEEYLISDDVRRTLWFEQCDARLKDSTRDQEGNGRLASATVQRDKNLADYRCRIAQLQRPDVYGRGAAEVNIGVTLKRIVVLEKFDGATIKRFQTN